MQAFSSGLLSAFGHNPKFAIRGIQRRGAVRAGARWKKCAANCLNQAGSLKVIDEISEKDRREIQRQKHDEVLETARFPEIHFESPRRHRPAERRAACMG